ncbi:MAG: DUF362 domain-containing protein [bacterium]|nr:DUF362 domain-containing protein [bacterium]
MRSKVYFAAASVKEKQGILERIEHAINLEFSSIIEKGEIVAIKVHLGEAGNTRYIRPIFLRKVVEFVKSKGGRPFVTDTTTLYRYKRANLFDYLETARSNGFTPETLGCPIIIADGFKNTGVEVEIQNPLRLSKVKVAQSIYEADCMISISHTTFHPFVTPASSIKNIGMGCVTKETKLRMHTTNARPLYKSEKCIRCGICIKVCLGNAFKKVDEEIKFSPSKCIGCGFCIAECPGSALQVSWDEVSTIDVQKGVIDSFRGVSQTFKKNRLGFINLSLDVTLLCDCVRRSDIPVIPDLGAFISRDALAVDKANYDLINKQVGYPDGKLWNKTWEDVGEFLTPGIGVLRFFQMGHGAGIGSIDYELIEI